MRGLVPVTSFGLRRAGRRQGEVRRPEGVDRADAGDVDGRIRARTLTRSDLGLLLGFVLAILLFGLYGAADLQPRGRPRATVVRRHDLDGGVTELQVEGKVDLTTARLGATPGTAVRAAGDDADQASLLRRLVVDDERDVVEFIEESGGLEQLFMSLTEGIVQ